MQRLALVLPLVVHSASAFAPRGHALITRPAVAATRLPAPRAEEFTEVQRLRAEAESPFAQVRLFALPVLFAGAGIATYFAATGLLASAVGVREASETGITDLLIDLGSMGATGYLWRREVVSREARLKRIAFGSQLAALRISQLQVQADAVEPSASVSLADLRRGRGQARRIVLVCAAAEELKASLETACNAAAQLAAADYLIVPLVATDGGGSTGTQLTPPPLALLQELASQSASLALMPQADATPTRAAANAQPALPWEEAVKDAKSGWPIALPTSDGAQWTSTLSSEIETAVKQQQDVMTARGLTIVLKKNGRVSSRRLGTPDYVRLIDEVEGRKALGFDTVNI